MTGQRFPKINAAGQFNVKIGFPVEASLDEKYVTDIRNWMNQCWIPENHVWRREWKTGAGFATENTEELFFEDSFVKAPEVVLEAPATLCVVLHGRDRRSPWRDWLVSRIIPDLRAKFPQVGGPSFIADVK